MTEGLVSPQTSRQTPPHLESTIQRHLFAPQYAIQLAYLWSIVVVLAVLVLVVLVVMAMGVLVSADYS